MEQDAEAVVVERAEAVAAALHLLDGQVDGLDDLRPMAVRYRARSLTDNLHERRNEEERTREELRAEYQSRSAHRGVYLYENARARGFGDSELEFVQRIAALGVRVMEASAVSDDEGDDAAP